MSEPLAVGAGAPADPDPLAPDDVVDAVAAFVDDLVEDDGAEGEGGDNGNGEVDEEDDADPD
ncbi:MAG TPA: hypothetical protein VK611_09455 [Acidimicrobiales bacterium]|nr:hypothetical protein [Acidimicrobiales bacterium]